MPGFGRVRLCRRSSALWDPPTHGFAEISMMNRLLVLAVLSIACGSLLAEQNLIEIRDLLSDPKRYDGQEVLTFGVLTLEFENFHIASGDDALWLGLFTGPPFTQDSIDADWARIRGWRSQFDGKCVVLRGTFRKGLNGKAGHFGMWPAEIGAVTEVRLSENRSLCD